MPDVAAQHGDDVILRPASEIVFGGVGGAAGAHMLCQMAGRIEPPISGHAFARSAP